MKKAGNTAVYDAAAPEAEVRYVEWLRKKLTLSLSDARPHWSHDQVEDRVLQQMSLLKASRPRILADAR